MRQLSRGSRCLQRFCRQQVGVGLLEARGPALTMVASLRGCRVWGGVLVGVAVVFGVFGVVGGVLWCFWRSLR